jgi:hypothetical protein
MIVDTVLQLRRLPVFNGNVIDALNIPALKDYVAWPDANLPLAIVIPMSTKVSDNFSMTDDFQIMTKEIAIYCVFSNSAGVYSGNDRRGSALAEQIDAVEFSLMKAILNWNPYNPVESNLTEDDPAMGHAKRGFRYVGSGLVQNDYELARSAYLFSYEIDVQITGADGFEPTGVPLEEITFSFVDEKTGDVLESSDVTGLQDLSIFLKGVGAGTKVGKIGV